MNYQQLYFCNPSLNLECPKDSCYLQGGPCQCTSHIEYAQRDLYENVLPADGEEFDQNGTGKLESTV